MPMFSDRWSVIRLGLLATNQAEINTGVVCTGDAQSAVLF